MQIYVFVALSESIRFSMITQGKNSTRASRSDMDGSRCLWAARPLTAPAVGCRIMNKHQASPQQSTHTQTHTHSLTQSYTRKHPS